MEKLFRRRFFLVHLAFIALAAILLARSVTSVAAHIIVKKLGAAESGRSESRAAPTKTSPPRDIAQAANYNIFEGRREAVVEHSAAGGAEQAPDDGEWWNAPRTSLRLRLVGTVVFTDPTASLASIVDEAKGGSSELYTVNECIAAPTEGLSTEDLKLVGDPTPCNKIGDVATLKRVEPEKVYIYNESDHRFEYISIAEPPEKGGTVARSETKEKPAESSKADDEVGKEIRKTGENSYEVGQGEVDRALANLSELATQARIVPAFEGGKSVGFKLFSIRPNSLYSKIGLQNGDIINRINGYEITSPEQGLQVYQKLKDAKQVTVDVKRRGKPATLDYSIVP